MRHRIVVRWQELEKSAVPAAAFQVPTTFAGALRLAAEQAERIEQQQRLLAAQAPQVEALIRIAEAPDTLNLCQRDAAKHLQIKPAKFTAWLIAIGWTYRRTENSRIVANQDKLDRKYLAHKMVEYRGSDGGTRQEPHVRVTPRGLARLAVYIEKGKGPA